MPNAPIDTSLPIMDGAQRTFIDADQAASTLIPRSGPKERSPMAALIVSLATAAVFAAGWAIRGLGLPETSRFVALPCWA